MLHLIYSSEKMFRWILPRRFNTCGHNWDNSHIDGLASETLNIERNHWRMWWRRFKVSLFMYSALRIREFFYDSFWDSCRILAGFLQDFCRILPGFLQDSFRILLRLFWDGFGIVLGLFWDSSGLRLGLFRNSVGIILDSLWNLVKLLY